MDYQTRNEFDRYCALAEIEEDPKRFAGTCRSIIRLLEAKQAILCVQLRATRIQNAATLQQCRRTRI